MTPTTDPIAKRNFRLGVLNGGLYQGGEGFVDASTVIPVLLSGLTRSNMLIGLGASLNDTGWLLPQIFVAPWASRHAQQLWIYRRSAVVRASALVLLAALAAGGAGPAFAGPSADRYWPGPPPTVDGTSFPPADAW